MNSIEIDQNDIFLNAKSLKHEYRILDIGGGGEGIISKLYNHQVVAIDIREDELVEIEKEKSLKIIMDATNLSFIDNQFNKVTAFYSFMYMKDRQIEKAISEAVRVLKPAGEIEIWDVEMPSINEIEEDIFIAQVKVSFNNTFVTTGYGVKLRPKKRSFEFYKDIILDKHLEIIDYSLNKSGHFHFLLRKES